MLMFLFYILSVFTSYESLPTEIKVKLEAEFSSHKNDEFEVVNCPKNFKNIQYRKNEDLNVIGSTAYIPIEITDNKGNKKRTTLSVRVKIYEDVFVAMNSVKKYNQLKATDFQLIEKEITSVRGEIVLSMGEILGKRADRFIRKGDILTKESLEIMPVIFPGDKLSAASIVGNVQVTFSAIANQEGSVGDVIRIRVNGNEIYKAEIINYKNVLIIE
ncbi:MAG: flagellar basal body P-ring formation chaperone FlgA [Melioribacteraceae bacterium]|jgi:flagella basal body P-ring formation protein FlgA|nr:flagellar basal body P-ring formation chaperone FlgA [Melioribacteraceae bacterium]